MRCKKSERWISDHLGGILPEGKRRRLDAHLAECSSCRSALRGQEKLQRAARVLAVPERSPEYWENSLTRLRAKLESGLVPQAVHRPARAFVPGPRWAWAGGATTLAVAAGLFFLVLRGGAPLEFWPAFEDTYGRLAEQIGESADLERNLDTSLQATIGEHAAGVDGEVHHLLYGRDDFLESLSDEEVRILETEISKALKIKEGNS